jgi:predicted KAP-like P-loop ATPase
VWSDNETTRDFLNFRMVAETAAEVIVQAAGTPLSLGVSGSWGVGKSSMLRLIQGSLATRGGEDFVFVEFNAWLYQGYDDARAALMDVIARSLVKRAEEKTTGLQKARNLLSRVDWLRLVKLGGTAAAVALGLPPAAMLGDALGTILRLMEGAPDRKALTAATATGENLLAAGEKVADAGKGVLKGKKAPDSPPKEIQDLRDHFEATLEEMKVRLVVFVDDLDRCLPETAIATLEAMRLFLFLKGTAFVIAADDKMIRQAVRAHFKGVDVDNDLVTNYFDKLIQVPFRVPPLGTQDVRAYMMLLYIENSSLTANVKDDLRTRVCQELGQTWKGKRVDRTFVVGLIADCPPDLLARLDTADRLAPLMASSPQIAGNPRLIKRFLNTLSIRMSIARAQSVNVDEAALAKMLLFERCGGDAAYAALVAEINDDEEGKPRSLKPLEEQAAAGQTVDAPKGWSPEFAKSWLTIEPPLADMDLRPIVHVSREHLPIITAADQLSSDAAAIFTALVQLTKPTTIFKDRIVALGKHQIGLVMDRLLARARQVQEWGGNVKELAACLTLTHADADQGPRLASLLGEVPAAQLKPALVPLIASEPWATSVFAKWQASADLPGTVKRAITTSNRNGGVA